MSLISQLNDRVTKAEADHARLLSGVGGLGDIITEQNDRIAQLEAALKAAVETLDKPTFAPALSALLPTLEEAAETVKLWSEPIL